MKMCVCLGQEWEGGERKYRRKNCRYFQLTCNLILNTSSPDFLSMHILCLCVRVEVSSLIHMILMQQGHTESHDQ